MHKLSNRLLLSRRPSIHRIANRSRRSPRRKKAALATLFTTDPDRAKTGALGHPQEAAKNTTQGLHHNDAYEKDYSALTALAERLPAGDSRGGATYRILLAWVREDPHAAKFYPESLDPATRYIAFENLATNWAQYPSAAEWLQTAPDIPIANRLLRDVIRKTDAAELAEIAKTLPPARAGVVREALPKQVP